MDGSAASVTIKRGSSEAAASSTCGSGSPSLQPCKAQPLGTNVYVTLTNSPASIVPLVPVPSTLTGKGVYRCEFQ